jgi:hypothetical protein
MMVKRGFGWVQVQLYSLFNLGDRWEWMVNMKPWPLYHWKRDPVSILQEAWWASVQVWTATENLAPAEFKPQIVQPTVNYFTDYTIPAAGQTRWHPNRSRQWEGLNVPVWAIKMGANQQGS